jgi:hypothetical protein
MLDFEHVCVWVEEECRKDENDFRGNLKRNLVNFELTRKMAKFSFFFCFKKLEKKKFIFICHLARIFCVPFLTNSPTSSSQMMNGFNHLLLDFQKWEKRSFSEAGRGSNCTFYYFFLLLISVS